MGLSVLITPPPQDKSLGTATSVAAAFKRVFAGAAFTREHLAGQGGGFFDAVLKALGAKTIGPMSGPILVAHIEVGKSTIEVQFADVEQVPEVLLTLYGQTLDADPKIDELCSTQGWRRSYA
jgi:hypothetical protein